MPTFTEEDHKTHDPINRPEVDCAFCVAERRHHTEPQRHGDGAGSKVIPVPPKKAD